MRRGRRRARAAILVVLLGLAVDRVISAIVRVDAASGAREHVEYHLTERRTVLLGGAGAPAAAIVAAGQAVASVVMRAAQHAQRRVRRREQSGGDEPLGRFHRRQWRFGAKAPVERALVAPDDAGAGPRGKCLEGRMAELGHVVLAVLEHVTWVQSVALGARDGTLSCELGCLGDHADAIFDDQIVLVE